MTWTRLSDDFNDRADLLGVSRSARLLLVELLVFGNRLLLDGKIRHQQVRRLTDSEDPDTDLAELMAAGLVDEVDGYLVVDWTDQESSDDVRARRHRQAEKQKAYRRRKQMHASGDHQMCDPRHCRSARATPETGLVTGNESGNKTGGVTPSRPDPSRPKDRGRGERRAAADVPSSPTARSDDARCEEHPTEPQSTCASCWADVHAGDRDRGEIGRRLHGVAS